jgi:hypothetical protein
LITFILALAIKNNVIINPDTVARRQTLLNVISSLKMMDRAGSAPLQTPHISALNYLVYLLLIYMWRGGSFLKRRTDLLQHQN